MTDREYIIGVSTVETMNGKMVLVAIEDQDNMSRDYTDLRYNCYTYGNGKAYYWEKSGEKGKSRSV